MWEQRDPRVFDYLLNGQELEFEPLPNQPYGCVRLTLHSCVCQCVCVCVCVCVSVCTKHDVLMYECIGRLGTKLLVN